MSSEGRQLRFLVVDDNEDIRDVFCRLIERAGHEAETAVDGQEAVETLQAEKFDVMLTVPAVIGSPSGLAIETDGSTAVAGSFSV